MIDIKTTSISNAYNLMSLKIRIYPSNHYPLETCKVHVESRNSLTHTALQPRHSHSLLFYWFSVSCVNQTRRVFMFILKSVPNSYFTKTIEMFSNREPLCICCFELNNNNQTWFRVNYH